MTKETPGNHWWTSVTSLLWRTGEEDENEEKKEVNTTDENMEETQKTEEPIKKNTSMLYTILSSNLESLGLHAKEEKEDAKPSEVEEIGQIKNNSSLYKILSSQKVDAKEGENDYDEILQNINYETENRLSIAENALYYIEEEEKSEQKTAEDSNPKKRKSSVEIKLSTLSEFDPKAKRPQSDVVPTKEVTLDEAKARPKSNPEQVFSKKNSEGMPSISFSFLEQTNELENQKSLFYDVIDSEGEYLPMNEKRDENPYASPRNSINSKSVSRENSPNPSESYVGPEVCAKEENTEQPELFYAASEIINNRPQTPFERRKECDYEDLDVENQELPALPSVDELDAEENRVECRRRSVCGSSHADDYADVDMNDYCVHREQIRPNLKKLTLLRNRKTKTVGFVKVRSKLNKAWKSVKGWMNEEKERLEDAKERLEDKLEDAKERLEDVIANAQARSNRSFVDDTTIERRKSRESLYQRSKHKSQIIESYYLDDVSTLSRLPVDVQMFRRAFNEEIRTAEEDDTARSQNGGDSENISSPSSADLKNSKSFDFSHYDYDFKSSNSENMDNGCSLSDSDAYVDMSSKSDVVDSCKDYRLSSLTVLRRRGDNRPSSRSGLRKSRHFFEGQTGFEELRKYIKQGGDFCKELSAILQERSEAETQYAKSLSKLSAKLLKTSRDAVGSVSEAWQRVGAEMEAQSEVHRAFATSLSDDVVKPLRQLLESQHRVRKNVENLVDKTSKGLSEWRQAECKSKKQSFVYSRENEKLQDAMLDFKNNKNGSTLHLHHYHHKILTDKESAKLDTKRKKAEESVKKADVEYYSFCVRAERARLEWETAVTRGSQCFQTLEEERLTNLKQLAGCYLKHFKEIGPRLIQCGDRLTEPVLTCDVTRDIQTVVSMKGNGHVPSEQLLPDFYAEHVTLAMNRERRRQALVKLLQLIRQDLERERRGKQGVENLQRALQQTPNFGAEESQQNVDEKLHHMKSMLIYLEAARFKIQCALAELEGRTRPSHPLAQHIQVTRDRQGLQHSVLRVPTWLGQWQSDTPDWTDREAGDGTSVQPDSDFDEFSSVGSDKDYQQGVYQVVSECPEVTNEHPVVGQCRALYEYTAKLYDELNLQTGDVIKIHDKQPDGWWLGELHGVVGIFPATYVEEIN